MSIEIHAQDEALRRPSWLEPAAVVIAALATAVLLNASARTDPACVGPAGCETAAPVVLGR